MMEASASATLFLASSLQHISTRGTLPISSILLAVRLHVVLAYAVDDSHVIVFDEFLVKYGASITGYAILALPVIEGRVRNMNAGDLTNEYVRNRQLLINLAKGIAQLVVLSNKVYIIRKWFPFQP